jgi:hypothetical protein
VSLSSSSLEDRGVVLLVHGERMFVMESTHHFALGHYLGCHGNLATTFPPDDRKISFIVNPRSNNGTVSTCVNVSPNSYKGRTVAPIEPEAQVDRRHTQLNEDRTTLPFVLGQSTAT